MEKKKDSGYRIRCDLLELARGILSERQQVLFDLNKKGDAFEPYTAEQVIEEAQKLYEFVQTKD